MVPARVLKHANAFMRLFRGFARVLARPSRDLWNCISNACRADVQALMYYTLHASYSWAHARPWRGVAFRKSPWANYSTSSSARTPCAPMFRFRWGSLGRCSTHWPDRCGERNAACIFGTDETLSVVGGTSASNSIVWHGMVSQGDSCCATAMPQVHPALADHDRGNADLSRPSRNALEIIGPISREQFAPESIRKGLAASRSRRCRAARSG